jgi:hypothetical protein
VTITFFHSAPRGRTAGKFPLNFAMPRPITQINRPARRQEKTPWRY